MFNWRNPFFLETRHLKTALYDSYRIITNCWYHACFFVFFCGGGVRYSLIFFHLFITHWRSHNIFWTIFTNVYSKKMFIQDEGKIECAVGNREMGFWLCKKAEIVLISFLTSWFAVFICLWLLVLPNSNNVINHVLYNLFLK